MHAPAKLNLCLELLGKRSDGFHELRTVMASVRLFDTLRLRAIDGVPASSLSVVGSGTAGVPVDRTNLVLRALDSLQAEAGVESGVEAQLVKRIPNQAGLGGGSSDAAAALVAADRVWGLGWSVDRLAEIGARIGSDIPFFVHVMKKAPAWAALATGRGERITTSSPQGGLPVVIVKPPGGLSTAGVFAATKSGDWAGGDDPAEAEPNGSLLTLAALGRGHWCDLARGMRNQLQAAAERVAPWLRQLRERFDECGCEVHQLSGSGSAYFGLAGSMREAGRLAARLRALRVGRVYATVIG